MQPRVAEGDREAEPGPPDRAFPARIGPPEPVEHAGGVLRRHADALVADGDRDAARVAVDHDLHGLRITVLDRVADEVPQDPPDPLRVELHRGVAAGGGQLQVDAGALGEGSELLDDVDREGRGHDGFGVELHGLRVVAGDLEEVGEQELEALDLGVQELRRPTDRRLEGVPGVEEHVAGEPDRRERGPELVRDVRHEPLLHAGELGELGDLPAHGVRHVVEAPREDRDVVVPADGDAFVEAPRRDLPTGLRRTPDRHHHEPHDEGRHEGDQHDERDAADRQGLRDEVQGLLRVGEVVDDVELVLARARDLQHRPDGQPGFTTAAVVEPHGLQTQSTGVLGDLAPECVGDDLVREVRARQVLQGLRGGLVRAPLDRDARAAGARRVRQDRLLRLALQRLELGLVVVLGRRRRVEDALRHDGRPGRLRLDLVAALGVHVVRDADHHRGADHHDGEPGGQDGDGDRPDQQGASPEPGDGVPAAPDPPADPATRARRPPAAEEVARRSRRHGAQAPPARYPTPRTVVTIRGLSGSCSIFARSRCTWTFTSRVSAL